jgi:PAS domain-containing protein
VKDSQPQVADVDRAQDDFTIVWMDIDNEGRYVDASGSTIDVLGYTLDEIRQRCLGGFSEPAIAAAAKEIWPLVVAGTLRPLGGTAVLHAADGHAVWVQQEGIERIGPDRHRSTLRVIAPGASPPAVHVVLGLWRAAERRVQSLAQDDPERPIAEAQVDRLREEYAVAFERAQARNGVTSPG